MRLNLSIFGSLAAALVLQAAQIGKAAPMAVTTVLELPRPTGRFPVGTYMATVSDPDRREIFTADPSDRRRVSLQIYYPAAKGCPPQAYIPSPLADMLGEGFRAEKGFERRLMAHACNDAKPAVGSEKYPLVLFSHGLGTTHFYYVSLLEDLASQGNIVVAIDHTYGARATYFADGSVVRRDGNPWASGGSPEQAMSEYYRNWAEDARRVLDRIFDNDGIVLPKNLARRVDLDRVAYLGHSYGGLSAIYAAQLDSRVKAAANLDGGVGPSQDTEGTKRPGRMLLPVIADVPIMVLNSMGYDQHRFYAKPARHARIRGSQHMTFSDLVWLREMSGTDGNSSTAGNNALGGLEGVRLTRLLSSLFLECAFTQNCARLDDTLDAARMPSNQ